VRDQEVILLVPDARLRAHTRALLEQDGYAVTEAQDATHAHELARASRARAILVQHGVSIERLEAALERTAPFVDVLVPTGFGHALLEGVNGGRRALMGLDALVLLANILERSTSRPDLAERASQWAELTAHRLGLSPLQVETAAVSALLASLGPSLAHFRFGLEPESRGSGWLSGDLQAALACAALLRTPCPLQETIRAIEERFDGRGRPEGKKGTEIPIAARVAAVARDHALAVQESGASQALTLLQERSGRDYDPEVVDAFSRVLRASEYVHRLSASRSGPTVAVIDGDPSSLAVAELRLSAAGFNVRTYLDGRTARDSLASVAPDAVISEVAVPGFDGISLLAKLKREPATENVPFFVLAAGIDRATATKVLRLGAADAIAKPAHWDVLTAKIREALAGSARATASGTGSTTGTSGELGELSLLDLLQVLALGRKTATIYVEGKHSSGKIALDRGEPIAAVTHRARGLDAFVEMASVSEGRFTLDAGNDATKRNLHGTLEGLILEALRRQDEAVRPPKESA
jgi:response regulator RpfG family c-di-GMP phosphodiesterase